MQRQSCCPLISPSNASGLQGRSEAKQKLGATVLIMLSHAGGRSSAAQAFTTALHGTHQQKAGVRKERWV